MIRSTSENAGRRRRILIVEDDALMRILYGRIFNRHKNEFVCHMKSNAQEALEHLRSGKVDAAVLDWELPRTSGLQLLRAIRSSPETQSLRVILVSGRIQVEDQVQALERGADDFLAKPFHVEVFLARLRRLLRR